MPSSGSFIILAVAIGAVAFLLAGDYYFRYIDKKISRLPLVNMPQEEGDLELKWEKKQDKEDNIAA